MLHRIPSLGDAVLERLCNGPEAFSPDCKWIVGEAPEMQKYYIAAGMKTVIFMTINLVFKFSFKNILILCERWEYQLLEEWEEPRLN